MSAAVTKERRERLLAESWAAGACLGGGVKSIALESGLGWLNSSRSNMHL